MSIQTVETAIRDYFSSCRELGAAIENRDDLLAVRTGIPLTFFNGICRTRFDGDADAQVKTAIEWFREYGVGFRWWLLPSNEPRDLIAHLAANRMRHVYYATGMWADLETAPLHREVAGLEIVRVRDEETLATFIDVFARVFSIPTDAQATWHRTFTRFGFHDNATWREYLAILDGVPVATSALCLGPEIGGIYHVGTLPGGRGRGVGAAVTAAAMLDAKNAGRRLASLQSSEMAVNVYRSLGFEAVCDLELYDWRPEYDG